MQINIKKIGFIIGTSGWLAKGLADGSITISEGVTKNDKNHGLWAHYLIGEKKEYECLALFATDWASSGQVEEKKYMTARKIESQMLSDGHSTIWTNAAWDALMALAYEWTLAAQVVRDADPEISISVVRVKQAA